MAKNTKTRLEKEFKIIGVSREDLETFGYNTSAVDDSTMECIADDMAEDFCQEFEDLLAVAADKLNIPKR
jgi:hypothetical protein